MLERLANGEAKDYQVEKRYLHKSGRPVWVLLTVTPVPRPDPLHPALSIGLVQDISKRKAAEEALQKSEALFRTIGENAGDLILIIDYPGMQTLYVSPAYQNLLGYSVDELQGHNSLDVVHPDDLPLIQLATEDMVRKGTNGVILGTALPSQERQLALRGCPWLCRAEQWWRPRTHRRDLPHH